MASALAIAHITVQQRLREIIHRAIAAIWRGLSNYDEENVEPFIRATVPVVLAGQRKSVALTETYVARALERPPFGVDVDTLVGPSVRNGVQPEAQWRRPFVTTWSALQEGKQWEDAVVQGLDRATQMAETDVQLSSRATFQAVQDADDRIFGYQRVARAGACPFCRAVDGAYVKSAMAMGLHPHCVVGDTEVWAPSGRAVTRRRYEGQVVVLKTAAGHELTVTPNHPVLTPRSWVAAGLLREGDNVVSGARFHREQRGVPDEQDVPTCIEDRFRAGDVASLVSVPFAAEQFHGDIGDGEVDVVETHGGLDARLLAALEQPREQLALPFGVAAALGLQCECPQPFRRGRHRSAAFGGVGRRHSGHSRFGGLSRGGDQTLLRARALRDAGFAQAVVDDGTTYAVRARDLKDGYPGLVGLNDIRNAGSSAPHEASAMQFPGERFGVDSGSASRLTNSLAREVELDRLVSVGRRDVATHVYNLVTDGGWYTANSIVTHNCGCTLEALLDAHPRAVFLPDGTRIREHQFGPLIDTPLPDEVAVHEHGELGATLADPAHAFVGVANL